MDPKDREWKMMEDVRYCSVYSGMIHGEQRSFDHILDFCDDDRGSDNMTA